jgi:hypothetical protein
MSGGLYYCVDRTTLGSPRRLKEIMIRQIFGRQVVRFRGR